MQKPDFSKFHDFPEMTKILKDAAENYPELTTLRSIGRSIQGRDLWVMEITNKKTGAGGDKPAFWIDGNTHAGEVTGREVALKTIWYLVANYNSDSFVTELLDSRCIYIMPCLNPDGSELYLNSPFQDTAGAIPSPEFEDEFSEGLYPEDIDKDGEILMIRIKDPNGDWKASERDPRLMVKRKPGEIGGTYYRIYPEGLLKRFDGKEIKMAPSRWIGGSNRNYPAHWDPTQQGQTGLLPVWEKEVRAQSDFFTDHKNIGYGMTHHTHGGMLLRPSAYYLDSQFYEMGLGKDLALFKAVGTIGEEMTRYPYFSPYEGMTVQERKQEKKPYGYGTSMDTWYEFLGIGFIGYEFWDIMGRAGLPNYKERGPNVGYSQDLTEEQGLKVLAWNDQELKGSGFVAWKPLKHPQLGPVEVGGWKLKFTWRNPPPHLLESEIDKTMMWALRVASLLPLVKIAGTEVISLGDDLYKVEATIENRGFMPTYVTQMAIKIGVAKPVRVKVDLGDDVELVHGREKQAIGHLEGQSDRLPGYPAFSVGMGKTEESKRTVEWVFRAKRKIPKVTITSVSEKGGRDTKAVNLA